MIEATRVRYEVVTLMREDSDLEMEIFMAA